MLGWLNVQFAEMNSGYDRLKQTADYLKGIAPKPALPDYSKYSLLSLDELEEKKEIAQVWLKENENHPRYKEALSRLEVIYQEITVKKAKDIFSSELTNNSGWVSLSKGSGFKNPERRLPFS